MSIEAEAKVINDQVAVFNTALAAAFAGGKMNKAAIKRARAALNDIKKACATLRKELQAKVTDATLAAAGGRVA
jgi:hypothetical protein